MTDVSPLDDIAAIVQAGWNRHVRSSCPLGGGMNSATARVELADGDFVAKAVPINGVEALDAGCAIAARLAGHGLLTGEPLPTTVGGFSFRRADHAVALLLWVPGSPLTGETDVEQRWMASTLARVHAVPTADGSQQSPAVPFMADLEELVHDVEPWIRPAVREVVTEQAQLPPLTWGTLHTDPAPEAFRYDEATDRCGLIDWTGAVEGPILYDLASACMYLGGRASAEAFWSRCLELSPAPAEELNRYLPAFSRLRAAVQVAYFSIRVATSDLTGISDQQENWVGLRDGQRMVAESGVRVPEADTFARTSERPSG